MVDLLSPDVLSEEVQGNSGVIPAASTSAFSLAGYSTRGPENTAVLATSFTQFVNVFGTFTNKSLNIHAVAAYFLNGGNRLWFVRVLHSDATYATGTFVNTWDVQALGRGIWANLGEVTLAGNANFYTRATGVYTAFDLTIELIDPNTGLLAVSETYEAVTLNDPTDPEYVVEVLKENSLDVSFAAVSGGTPLDMLPTSFTGILVGTGNGSQTLFSTSLAAETPIADTSMSVYEGATLIANDDGNGNLVGVQGGPSVSGTIDYVGGALGIVISPAPGNGVSITTNFVQKGAQSSTIVLNGGSDGSRVTAADVVNVGLAPNHQGLYALDLVDEQMSLALPDYAGDPTTDLALLTYANGRLDIVVILQPPQGSSPQSAVNYRRNQLQSQSSYGAMYYPWVTVPNPLNNNRPLLMPPSGHVAGRYAFTDISENVGKAPAGITRGALQFISGVERKLTKGDRDTVYPAQINPIRSDADVGTAIWGNKTLQVVGDYTDVNIRRTFINLEKEQQVGLLDLVFEDVGPTTFGLITTRLDNYLENKFTNNVIGSGVPSKDQAFKVVCNESNNPESVQITKVIIVDEFIKPNLAAEIILLRLQKVFDASQS
jgi:uncharacterized protein